MNEALRESLNEIRPLFPKAFINLNYELILEPKNNIYFRLEDVHTHLEFKCKMIENLSRPSHKGVGIYWEKQILQGLNKYLGADFSREEMSLIYTRLGNGVNRKLCEKFIKFRYDMELLERK